MQKVYGKKVLNEENTWDIVTTCEKVEGPCELIRRDEILKRRKVKQLALQELCRKC